MILKKNIATVKEEIIALLLTYKRPADFKEILSILKIAKAEIVFMHRNQLEIFSDHSEK